MPDLHDYLLDHATWDWPVLLRKWTWLVPPSFTPWIVNRFGDLFIILGDASIHHLDIGVGTLYQVAPNRDEFCKLIDDSENSNNWLMIPLVDQLVAANKTLSVGECYSYRLAPAFGGSYTIENTKVLPVAQHYDTFGPLHELAKDVPNGTQVQFKVR